MKYFFVFALLIGSISATELAPQQASVEPRFIDTILEGVFESVAQNIRDQGLDPLLINREAGQFALAVPEIFTAFGYVENLSVVGLSNIRVNNIGFTITRLTFDIELPRIDISIGRAYGQVSGFGDSLEGLVAGRVAINSLGVSGEAQLSLIGGISVSSLNIELYLDSIDAGLTVLQIHRVDFANAMNNFLGETVPRYISDHREDISYVLSDILLRVINNILDGLTFARKLV